MKFIENAKISNRKMTLEVSYLQAIHLVTLLKSIPKEENLNGIIVTNIINQIDDKFSKVSGYDLMVMQEEIK